MRTKELIKKIKEINKINLAEAILPGYKFDKRIFRITLIIILASAFLTAINMNFEFKKQIYFKCLEKNKMPCENPFYYEYLGVIKCPDEKLCNIKEFQPGETYGKKPPIMLGLFGYYMSFLFTIALITNHLLYNRKYKFKKIEIKE